MSLEKDLQQTKPFKDDYVRGIVNLMFTSRYVESKLKKIYKAHGITMKQYNILRILRGAGKPISTQDIGERMVDRMSDISRLIDRMIDKQLVTKCKSIVDKRLVDIVISEKGLNILLNIDNDSSNHYSILNNLTKDEARNLNSILDKVRSNKI